MPAHYSPTPSPEPDASDPQTGQKRGFVNLLERDRDADDAPVEFGQGNIHCGV